MRVRFGVAVAALSAGVLVSVPGAASAKTVAPQGGQGNDSAYVTKGGTLRVVLRPADSGSSGYHWGYSARHVTTGKPLRFESAHSARDGKRQVLRFKARVTGIEHLTFRYLPPGKGGRAAKVASLDVAVNKPAPRLGCKPAGSKTVASSRKARIFKVHRSIFTPHAEPGDSDVLYGCERGRKRAYPLNPSSENAETATKDAYSHATVLGTKVGFVVGVGCRFDIVDSCGNSHGRARSVDLHTGRMLRSAQITTATTSQPAAFPADVTDFVMSPRGGLAWIEHDNHSKTAAVYKSDQAATGGRRIALGRERLASGNADSFGLHSLRRSGGFVYWLRGDAEFKAALR
jgi:hypothetical protein